MSNARVLVGVTATLTILTMMLSLKGLAEMPAADVNRFNVPATISPEAEARLSKLYAMFAHAPERERPKTEEDWDVADALLGKIVEPTSTAVADALHVTRTEDRLGGVPVLRVHPPSCKAGGPILLYLHGGAYTSLSAGNSLTIPALMSTASGYEVISVDYMLAPRADCNIVTDQVVVVWKAVLASGMKPQSVGMMGESPAEALRPGAS